MCGTIQDCVLFQSVITLISDVLDSLRFKRQVCGNFLVAESSSLILIKVVIKQNILSLVITSSPVSQL